MIITTTTVFVVVVNVICWCLPFLTASDSNFDFWCFINSFTYSIEFICTFIMVIVEWIVFQLLCVDGWTKPMHGCLSKESVNIECKEYNMGLEEANWSQVFWSGCTEWTSPLHIRSCQEQRWRDWYSGVLYGNVLKYYHCSFIYSFIHWFIHSFHFTVFSYIWKFCEYWPMWLVSWTCCCFWCWLNDVNW